MLFPFLCYNLEGDSMIKDVFNKYVKIAQDVINNKRQGINDINKLTNEGSTLNDMHLFNVNASLNNKGRENMIILCNPTINRTIAKTINSLIPVEETTLSIVRGIYLKDKIDIYLVATTSKLWLITKDMYRTYDYREVENFEIINKSILSQGVNFNNIAFNIEGRENDIHTFIDIVRKEDVRADFIANKTAYLLGIIPKTQFLNEFLSGISIDDRYLCVLHNKCANNTLIEIKKIEYMQILLDNAVVLTRGKANMTAQNSSLSPCRKMSIKFVTEDLTTTIDIIPENSLSTTYKPEDTVFRENFDFSIKLIDYVNDLSKNN